ncbi:MAG TPA: PQQ-binding-like beta-propeller repeat protein [Pyrinomonadaceae bacterium]|nr:PQQ-binding-like beta-propeller repeat protein [Pyrinomonadaceae bacterium]
MSNTVRMKKFFLLLYSALLWFVPISVATASPLEQVSLTRPFSVRWQFDTEETSNITPAIGRENIYLPLTSGTIISLRLTDGALNWKSDIGGYISASPAADERGVYVASETSLPEHSSTPRATGALRALSRQNGVTLWMRTLQAPIQGRLASNETTIFGGASDGRLFAVSKETGEVLWVKQHLAPFFSHLVLTGEHLYVGDEQGNLLAVDQGSGQTIWHYRTQSPLRAPVAVLGDTVFIGSTDSYVYSINETTGKLRWRVRTGAGIQSILTTPAGLIVTSLDNFVYCLSFNRGRKLWKRQLAGRVGAQPLATEDSALFAPLAGDECVVLSLHDGKKVNSLPVGEDNNMSASPVIADNLIILTTRKGLVAFANSLQDTTSQ